MMPELPLLFFPTPQSAIRTRGNPHKPNIHKPNVTRQGERLSPIFQQLENAFAERIIEIQANTDGIDPEQVLVIETVGSVEDFINAVRRINGLEWLAETEIDNIVPDDDFYDEGQPGKNLNGTLYLIMTNQQALSEMLSLWHQYQVHPDMQFRRGLTKFRDVFLQLKNIRRWDVQDRLKDTGVIENWQERLKYNSDELIPFEIELWFREDEDVRIWSAKQVTDLVQQLRGQILSQTVIREIAYHGLLAELPAAEIENIIKDPVVELVKCDEIMFFRPAGQMLTDKELPEGDIEDVNIEPSNLPVGEPVIALFDGLPLANHRLLAGRMIIDDPDNWEADYLASNRIHGTAMASLIAHGDLNTTQPPLARPIYVRPIMKPKKSGERSWTELIPDNCLIVDLIHRAVKRLFEGEEERVAPQIKVINLSIGDPLRQFIGSMSPLARLLDWLSEKYNILFIVSAGNHPEAITFDMSEEEFRALSSEKLEEETIKSLYKDIRNRKLLSPAETLNGISVGAVNFDMAQFKQLPARINLLPHLLPSPISAFGSGYRRAIKPDLIYYGGRQLYMMPLLPERPLKFNPAIFRFPPGNKAASPGNNEGDLNAAAFSRGTSNAAALLSRAAGICYDYLLQLFKDQGDDIDSTIYEAPLLKAMLVHGCSWNDMGELIANAIRTPDNGRQISGLISRWLGYGLPSVDKVLSCTEQRVTLLGFGKLFNDEAHIFKLPLPPSLTSLYVKRRLIVTLAWLSPIYAKTQKYRGARLWFEVNNNNLAHNRKDADRHAVRRGTVQHEIFEGQNAEPIIDGDRIEIKVNCSEDAGRMLKPVAYGLAVTLEVAEGFNIDIYSEVRAGIKPAIQIQQSI